MPPPRDAPNFLSVAGDYTTTQTVHSDTYAAIDPSKADFSGKAVFITGASKARGLGRAFAVSYAKAGASYIAIGARSSLDQVAGDIKAAAKEAGRPEPKVVTVKLDVTDVKSVDAAVQTIEKEFGRLDVVVNNAASIGVLKSIDESDPEEWWDTMTINVKGPYLITRATLPLLRQSDLKTIVNVSSCGAHLVLPTVSGYQTSKIALCRLTEFTAVENAEHGVVAFSIHPGNMKTDMVGHLDQMPPERQAVFVDTVELCADGVVFLTKERREWLSGRYINMTWDMPEFVGAEMVGKIVEGDVLKAKLTVPNARQ